jgi:2-polyprenyl-3-methyl-5-hydroxy-6-metoxy-1,4-benzoquinol methylase
MKCLVCNNETNYNFLIDQRLRGKVKWYKCMNCKSYFTPKETANTEVEFLKKNPWGKRDEGIELSYQKRYMFSNIYNLLDNEIKNSKAKVLDIGSSFGGFAKYLNEKNNEVYAYDIFDEPVQYLKSLNIEAVIANSITQYSIISNQKNFDLIAAIDCICYWENIDSEFLKIKELLRPGGYFVIRNPDKTWMLNLGKLLGNKKIQSICVHDHTNLIPLRTVIKKLKECNFIISHLSFKSSMPNLKTKFITRIMYYLGGILYSFTGFHFSPGYVLLVKKASDDRSY